MIQKLPSRSAKSAFTLIEIMVAVGIIAIILAIGIPTLFREAHQDSMRYAVSKIREILNEARARAVLDGVPTEVKFRPGDRTISLAPAAGLINPSSSHTSDPTELMEGGNRAGRGGGSGSPLSSNLKLSDHIIIDFLGVNLMPDLQMYEEVTAYFYPNGTADEIHLLIRSDLGEVRMITTEVVTGLVDVEVKK